MGDNCRRGRMVIARCMDQNGGNGGWQHAELHDLTSLSILQQEMDVGGSRDVLLKSVT